MLKKVEDSQSLMAVSFAPELSPNKFFPSMTCGVGVVRILNRYENGESDILVFGKERMKFTRYTQEVPYLIGEGTILEMNREMPKETEKTLLTDIREMLISWIFSNFDDASRPIQFFKNVTDLEPLCNFVAYYFVNDFDKKQKLLEENMLESKAQIIWQVLKDMEATGGPGPLATSLIFPKGPRKDDDTVN
jgi:ATP-dependent Lon protease